jgi:hypothetical protein
MARGHKAMTQLGQKAIRPRIGDFVTSELAPMRHTGFVIGYGFAGTPNIPFCQIRVANGSTVHVGLDEVIVTCPREWRDDWLHLGWRYHSSFWQPQVKIELMWGAKPKKK